VAHVSLEVLAKQLAAAAEEVEVGARYVHYKDQTKEYRVTGLVVLEATDEVAVVYEAQYDTRISFVRPLAGFCATVDVAGVLVPRFAKK
jgi:hypothetical protein